MTLDLQKFSTVRLDDADARKTFQTAMRETYGPLATAMWRDYHEGRLFLAQTQSFQDWREGRTQKRDRFVWEGWKPEHESERLGFERAINLSADDGRLIGLFNTDSMDKSAISWPSFEDAVRWAFSDAYKKLDRFVKSRIYKSGWSGVKDDALALELWNRENQRWGFDWRAA